MLDLDAYWANHPQAIEILTSDDARELFGKARRQIAMKTAPVNQTCR